MSANKRPSRLRATSTGPRPPRRVAGQSRRSVQEQVEPPQELSADETPREGILERRKTTVVLTSVLGVVLVLLLALTVTWFAGEPGEDEVELWEPTVGAGEFELPASDEHPVTVSSVEWAGSVDQVAKSVTKIFTFSAKTIDGHVDNVAPLMTEEFLDGEYQETFAATSGKVKANNADYQLSIVGQSVITASSDRVTTLLFANQFVSKGTGKSQTSELNPIRLIVSAVRDQNDWKIDQIKAG